MSDFCVSQQQISLSNTFPHLTQYNYNKRSQLNNSLTSYRLSSHISEQMLEVSSTWTNASRDSSGYGLLLIRKCHSKVANGLTGVNNWLEVFQLQLNTLVFLTVLTVKKLNEWFWTNVRATQLVLLYISAYHLRYCLFSISHTARLSCEVNLSCMISHMKFIHTF